MKKENFLGIDIFTMENCLDYFDYSAELEESYFLEFTNVNWLFDSMKKFNGNSVLLNRKGYFKVIDVNYPENTINKYHVNSILIEGYLTKIPEFKESL